MEATKMTGTEFRRNLTEALDRIHAGDHIEVTHYHRTSGYMVPSEWYQRAVAALAGREQHE